MTIVEIFTIKEALQYLGKSFQGLKEPERTLRRKLRKMGIKPLNGTITARQLEEFIEKCYTLDSEVNTGTFQERSALAINRKRSKNTLAAVIASKKQKNMQAA